MSETEETPRTEGGTEASQPQESEEKTDREEGGPTSSESEGEETGGATGTRPTEGFDSHE